MAITIVDTEERIRAFLPQLDEIVHEGLVILDDCEVIRYVGRNKDKGKHKDKSKGKEAQ